LSSPKSKGFFHERTIWKQRHRITWNNNTIEPYKSPCIELQIVGAYKKKKQNPLNIYFHHRPTKKKKKKKYKSRYSSYSTSFMLSFSSNFDSSSHALARSLGSKHPTHGLKGKFLITKNILSEWLI
jgi:hypothetical protein